MRVATLNTTVTIAVVSSTLSGAVCATAAYILTKKATEAKYEAILDEEIKKAKSFYKLRYKAEEYSDPVALLERKHGKPIPQDTEEEVVEDIRSEIVLTEEHERPSYKEMVAKINVSSPPKPVKEPEVVTNIFDSADPDEEDIDPEGIIADRDRSKPYIITHDEFYDAEYDYMQNSLSYFEGDEVLVDDQDQPIRDVRAVIGEENIRFGYASLDPNIVYIRNENLEVDFEVALSLGKYTEEILGYIQHEEKPEIRRVRRER